MWEFVALDFGVGGGGWFGRRGGGRRSANTSEADVGQYYAAGAHCVLGQGGPGHPRHCGAAGGGGTDAGEASFGFEVGL